MHRRGHRKSRNGCLECKRRHMKCDETRPQCANCTTVNRLCQYVEPQLASRASYPAVSATPASAGSSPAYTGSPLTETSTVTKSAEDGVTPAGSPASPASALSRPQLTPQTSAPQTPHIAVVHDAGDQDAPVNVLHAELAFHFSLATASPELDASLVEVGTRVVVEEALKAPFLLYECLAVSARHLSTLRPDQRDFYMRQSVQLQTKAIALYNGLDSVDQTYCVSSVLFSSILNRHTLADVLANRDGGFVAFLDRYVQCAALQKGIRAVSKSAWPQLIASDLRPIMEWSTPDSHNVTVGHHCDELRRLISLTPALGSLDKEACRTAIHFLQLAFDSCTNPPPGKSAHQIVYIWGMYLPDEFCALLKAHRPEAIAVLAWYSVLLHQSRDNWQVGDAGEFMLKSIGEFLGPEWAHWLEWPFDVLHNGLR